MQYQFCKTKRCVLIHSVFKKADLLNKVNSVIMSNVSFLYEIYNIIIDR